MDVWIKLIHHAPDNSHLLGYFPVKRARYERFITRVYKLLERIIDDPVDEISRGYNAFKVIWCLDKLRTMKITSRADYARWHSATSNFKFFHLSFHPFNNKFLPTIFLTSIIFLNFVNLEENKWSFYPRCLLPVRKEKKKKEARVSKLIENPGRHYAWHECIKFLDAAAKIGGSMQRVVHVLRASPIELAFLLLPLDLK